MNDKTIDFEARESAILHRLCEASPLLLSELNREYDEAEDCTEKLRRRGLVHRLEGGYLFPSAAGRHADAINESWR